MSRAPDEPGGSIVDLTACTVDRSISHDGNLPWLHGGDLIARQLELLGADRLFTLTGGHISTIYDGIRFTDIDIVDFRHEQAAAHAADAYARCRRDVSFCALTAGPGVTGGLTGIANAYYAGSPVLTIGGRNPFMTDGAGNLQEAPHLEFVKPVTKYCAPVHDVFRLPDILHDAVATAKAFRSGPSYVDIPTDVQLARMSSQSAPALRQLSPTSTAHPDPDVVEQVARLIADAHQPVVMAGTWAYWARAEAELRIFVETAQVPVYLNGMARGLLSRNCDQQIFRNRNLALQNADFVLLLGVDFDFRLNFGQAGTFHEEATIVQVDASTDRIGRNRSVDVGVSADPRKFLIALMEHSGRFGKIEAPTWLQRLRSRDAAAMKREPISDASVSGPINPMHFGRMLSDFLDEDGTLIGDGGDVVSLFAGAFKPGGTGQWMDPGPFGCLGIGVPFAMGARLARPDKQIAVLFGDGAFGFNAFEFEAAVRQKLPFVGIIGNDGAWGEMRTFHEDLFGNADLTAQYLSQDTRYEKVVEALGGYGERVESPAQFIPALERAFASGVPALVNVILDPSFRRTNSTVSGKHVALAYGNGDPNAFKR